MDINISKEDAELIRKFENILSRGYYCQGEEVTNLHNRILGTRLSNTNCSSCIRTRIRALVDALNKYERQQEKLQEASKQEEPVIVPEEENKPVRKAKNKEKVK